MSSSSHFQNFSDDALERALLRHGAATFGSTERKRQRLLRFVRSEAKTKVSQWELECAVRREQERVRTRAQARMAELRGEEEPPLKRQRITSESCPSPSFAPAPSPVRRPSPAPLPGTHRMVTRSMRRAW